MFKNNQRKIITKKIFNLNVIQLTKIKKIFDAKNSNINKIYIKYNKFNRKY